MDLHSFFDSTFNKSDVIYAFWISFFILILISLMKYFMAKHPAKDDWWHYLLEFPIDVIALLLTVMITAVKVTTLQVDILIFVVTLVVCLICCLLRRLSVKALSKDDYNSGMLVYPLLEAFVSCAWVFLLIKGL